MQNLEISTVSCLLLNMSSAEMGAVYRERCADAFAKLHGDLFDNLQVRYVFEASRKIYDEGGWSPTAVEAQLNLTSKFDSATWLALTDAMLSVAAVDLMLHIGQLVEAHKRKQVGVVLRAAVDDLQQTPADRVMLDLNTKLTKINEEFNSGGILPLRDSADEGLAEFRAAVASPSKLSGYACGIDELDRLTDGFAKGRCYVILATTNMGKSYLASSIMHGLMMRRDAQLKHLLLVSTEMRAKEWTRRVVARESMVNTRSIERGQNHNGTPLAEEQIDRIERAYAKLRALDSYDLPDAQPSMADIAARARALKMAGKLDLIIVDSGSNLRSGAGDIYLETRDMSNGLTSLAVELDVPVIVTIQAKPDVASRQNKVPAVYDAYGGGTTSQDAHVMIALYYHHFFVAADQAQPNEKLPQGTALITCLKHRYAPTVGEKGYIKFMPGIGFFNPNEHTVTLSSLM